MPWYVFWVARLAIAIGLGIIFVLISDHQMQSLGEMATWLPLPGAIPQFCARYVDGAMGFAVGWNVSLCFHASFNPTTLTLF